MRLLQPNRLLRRVLVSTAALVLKVGTVRMVLLAITALAMGIGLVVAAIVVF
jgi:hypothetical protein